MKKKQKLQGKRSPVALLPALLVTTCDMSDANINFTKNINDVLNGGMDQDPYERVSKLVRYHRKKLC